MNAYFVTDDGVHVIEGVGCMEVHPDQVALVRGGDPERRLLAAARLSDRLWVAIGDRPPARLPASPRRERTPARAASVFFDEAGWPPEPPPDVDSGI